MAITNSPRHYGGAKYYCSNKQCRKAANYKKRKLATAVDE